MSYTLVGIIAILVGLTVCFLGYRLFRLLLPLAGMVFGFALGALLAPAGQWLPWLPAVLIGLGLLFAILFAVLRKPAIMLSTAAGGAAAAVYGLGLLAPYFDLHSRPHLVATLLILALVAAGFIVQHATHKSRDLYSDIGY